jgi:hypothetical protein
MLLNELNEVETSSLKGIGEVCKGSNQECRAPEGVSDFEGLAVSLKRYPDTKPAGASDFEGLAVSLKRHPDTKPAGASDFDGLAVSLKRYPDTKPEFFSSVQKKAGCVEITTES